MAEQTEQAEQDQPAVKAEETTTQVVPAHSFMVRQREAWDPGQARLLRDTVARGLDDAEFTQVLELAAQLGLNPLAKEIWAAKSPARNGRAPRTLIIVGRDGLLRKAHEWSHPGYGCYRGIQTGVLRKEDKLNVEHGDHDVKVRPEFHPQPWEAGPIVGAFAKVMRQGIFPTFVWCSLGEYKPRSAGDQSPWNSQLSTMIEKTAVVRALRLAFSITGVVGEGEADRQLYDAETTAVEEGVDYGADEELAGRLATAMDRLGWMPAKRRAKLAGLDDVGRRLLASELGEAIDEQAPADAEVVTR